MTLRGYGTALALFSILLSAPSILEATDPPKKEAESKKQETKQEKKPAKPATPATSEFQTPAVLIKAIEQRNTELDKRAEQLDAKEQRLQILEKEVDDMLKKYSKIREELEQKEAEQKKLDEPKYIRLAKIYEGMLPEVAAARIGEMKETVALNILTRIKEKVAAKILSGMDPAKAAKYSEKLVTPPR